ncbi:hypothetical protein PIB30_106339, partial [Stylosanthes scabra]|nr:hypothetical protein [Stylosanthes scabra]
KCKLRRLRLAGYFYYHHISEEGLLEIAERLPMLEELDITCCPNVSSIVLEAIGRGCPLLTSFKFNENGFFHDGNGNDHAFAIARNMSNLRHLQLVRNSLDDSGVSAILDGCPLLESLDLRCCSNVELEGELRRRCDEQLKDFIEPDTPYAFRGYEFGLRFYGTEYNEEARCDDCYSDYSWFSDYSPRFQLEEEEDEEEAAAKDCEKIYGIWECAKNQRSRNAFKRYLTQKEKKEKKKNYKSKGKKKHIRKERALITTKAYALCFEMEET